MKRAFLSVSIRETEQAWQWAYDLNGGIVYANTRSEARSLVKQALHIPRGKRLPLAALLIRLTK